MVSVYHTQIWDCALSRHEKRLFLHDSIQMNTTIKHESELNLNNNSKTLSQYDFYTVCTFLEYFTGKIITVIETDFI